MIKFFRHIRQRMIKENRVSKYMLYAIGEIFLVVIGILIALSINNWNHEREASQKEELYLYNLKTDLENQIISIDVQLTYEQKYVDIAKPLLDEYHSSSSIIIDSTTSINIKILTERKTFIRTDPTYEDLISTGNISLIKNIELRNSLIEYYQELERFEQVLQNNNTSHVDEMYGQNIILSVYLGTPSQKLYDISNELLKDPERELILINLIDIRAQVAANNLGFMDELRDKTTEMIKLLKD